MLEALSLKNLNLLHFSDFLDKLDENSIICLSNVSENINETRK